MPTKTTVTVDTPARASATKPSPRITVNTGAAKTTKRSASKPSKTTIVSDPPPAKPSEAAASATAVAEDKNPKPRGQGLSLAVGIVAVVLICFVFYFAWKGITGVSSQAMATRLEASVAAEQEKNRSSEEERVKNLRQGFTALEAKIDHVVSDNKLASSKFAEKADELEKGMVKLAEGMKEIRGQVAMDFASLRKDLLKETEESRKQSNDKFESLASRIESKLNVPEPPPPPLPLPPKPITQEGTRTVTVSPNKHFQFEGEELRPGEMSKKYCIDDVKAGKIEISSKSGIIARNHLHAWRSGWIDTPVPASGTYVASPDAKYVSFYSLSDTFTVKRLKM